MLLHSAYGIALCACSTLNSRYVALNASKLKKWSHLSRTALYSAVTLPRCTTYLGVRSGRASMVC